MNSNFDFISKIVCGTMLGSCLTAWFNREKNKRDLCIQVYEKWISNPLYQDRKKVLRQLKAFFDRPLPPEGHWNHEYEKVKLSELQYLSTLSYSEDFIDKFIYVMIFFADLNKLMKSKLINVKLSQTLFKDTILPWYKYLDKIEFDLMEEEYSSVASNVNSLKEMLR